MTEKYFQITPRVRQRLNREIFGTLATEVYGDELQVMDCEDHFSKVRSAIAHLFHQQHFDSDLELSRMINKLHESHEQLLHSPEIDTYYSRTQQRRLTQLMDEIVSKFRRAINPNYSQADIDHFVKLCELGRNHFVVAQYDPNEFIKSEYLALAMLMQANFDAYQKTLNFEYVVE